MKKPAGSEPTSNAPPAPPPPPPPPEPAVPMPHVGARRSTRVFVPKAPRPQPAEPTRVLRSGKRLAFHDSAAHWLHWDTTKNGFPLHDDPKPPPPPQESPPTKSFGIVYSRKRHREQPKEDARFGIVFSRKNKRSKLAPFPPCSSSTRPGFLDPHFFTLLDGAPAIAGPVLLLVLVDTSFSASSHHFMRLILPVLRWMRHSRRQKLRNLASFLSSVAVATAFASCGLHFVKLRRPRACALPQRTLLRCGWCELLGAKNSEPLLSLNFSAVPSYFNFLHSVVALDSMYLPVAIRLSMHLFGGAEEIDPHTPFEEYSESPSNGNSEPAAVDMGHNQPCGVVQDFVPLEQIAGVVVHGLRLKKHQRKRSTMRRPRSRKRLAARLPDKEITMKQGAVASHTEVKLPPSTIQELHVEPVQPKAALEISLDMPENMDDSDVSTPMGSTGKQRRPSLKSPIERMNERFALSEATQNIDSAQCNANLLIIQSDRCWREEGAEVMLELSDSNEWCIAVKMHGVTRMSLKPSKQKIYVVNRFTHAYIWAVDDGWKLEFSDRWDWLLFKELHIEGQQRNSRGKPIPIPGVDEVSDYMGVIGTYAFSRPVPDYIRTVDDEIGRALSSDSIYDLDSEDERLLIQLNLPDSDRKGSNLNNISYEDLEKIITTFEKDAYKNPKGTNDVDQLLSRYPALGKDSNVLAVYEYWINKRYKKGVPLLRIFQGVPMRRGQLPKRSAVKKKRSFKRQRRRAGRGKPETFLQDIAQQEALQRVVEAEQAAKQAVQTAVRLRSRAQSLMENAELATYKSVMALRIAEAARISDSSQDLVSQTLD